MSAMRKVSMRGLAAHKVRFGLTVVSVVLGTAFIAASFVFTQMLGKSFDDIVDVGGDGVDTQVAPSGELDPGVPFDLVDTIAALDGVRAVEATVFGPVTLIGGDGKAVSSGGAPSEGFGWSDGPDTVSDAGDLTSGREPRRTDEIVLNVDGAETAGLTVGDSTEVVLLGGGVLDVEVVGVYDTPSVGLGGYVGVGFAPDQARDLFTDGEHASTLAVAADEGVSETVLTERVAAVLPEGVVARTGTEVKEASKSQFQQALSFINAFLSAFGVIALVVGSFIIANTFSMVVAQRSRELALLRAVGASRGQVARSVAAEALVVGVVGSALGLLGGLGLSWGLTRLLSALGSGIPVTGQQLSPTTVLVTMGVGVGVTLLAAMLPARRAGRVAPVEAMRGEFATPGANHVPRLVAGAVTGLLGVALTVMGVTGDSAVWLGLGFLGVAATVVVLSPVVAPGAFRVLSVVVARPFGSIGRMAQGNAARNPRRTAATALSLALGLALVTGFAVLGASTKASMEDIANAGMKWDYVVGGVEMQPIPAAAAQAVDDVPGTRTATMTMAPAMVGDEASYGLALTGELDRVVDLAVVDGQASLTPTTMLATQDAADHFGWHVGDSVTLEAPGRDSVSLTLAGTYDSEYFTPWIVDGTTLDRLVAEQNRETLQTFVMEDGAGTASLEAELDDAVAPFHIVTVDDREAFTAGLTRQVDIMLGVLYGLLALAVVISVLGIVNTLGLSVVERRREIGMLRAVGMLRSQVRGALYVESVLISVYGALIGLALGLGFGYLFARGLVDDGLTITAVPWLQALAFLVVAAAVGVLAALWPGHRAARTRPLEAIAAE